MMENQDATPLAPRATNQRQSAIITRSLDFVKLISMIDVPADAIVMGFASTDGTDTYQVSYRNEEDQLITIKLGPNRVLAEWAEAILAERRQHPRPSDLL